MAVSIRIDSNLPQMDRLFRALQQLGANPEPLMERLGREGESQTRMRFLDQVGPDGKPWTPSLRQQLYGGKTLTKDGHLGDTINGYGTRTEAVWGVNRIYAAIHQFGGVIKAKGAGGLRFQIGERWSTKRQVTIPARPFLGLSDTDRQDMLELASNHINDLIRRSAPGGA